jgi:hypothetical protein
VNDERNAVLFPFTLYYLRFYNSFPHSELRTLNSELVGWERGSHPFICFASALKESVGPRTIRVSPSSIMDPGSGL